MTIQILFLFKNFYSYTIAYEIQSGVKETSEPKWKEATSVEIFVCAAGYLSMKRLVQKYKRRWNTQEIILYEFILLR